jgi:hypothetical protein
LRSLESRRKGEEREIAAKSLADEAIDLAVVAHIWHVETPYDRLLYRCSDRRDPRAQVADGVQRVRAKWGRHE